MPLEFTLQQAPFRLGIDEGVDPHHVPFGTLVTAENAEWQKTGRIQKRDGTTGLTKSFVSRYASGSMAAGRRVFARGEELCALDGSYLYAYSTTLAAWRRQGSVPEVGIEVDTLVGSLAGIRSMDMAKSDGGLLVHAWVVGDPTDPALNGTGSVYAQIIDPATGSKLLLPTLVASVVGLSVRVICIGSTAFIWFKSYIGGFLSILCASIDLSTYAITSASILRSDVSLFESGWDVVKYGSTMVLSYQWTGAAPFLRLYKYDTSLVQLATGGVNGASPTTYNVALATDGTSIFVANDGGTDIKFSAYDTSLVNTLASVNIFGSATCEGIGMCYYDATRVLVAATTRTGADLPSETVTMLVETATGSVVTGSSRGTWGARIASQPFLMGGQAYLVVSDYPVAGASLYGGGHTYLVGVDVTQPALGLTDSATPHRFLGKIDHLIGGQKYVTGPVYQVCELDAEQFCFPSYFLSDVPATTRLWVQGARLVRLTIGNARPLDMWRPLSHGQDAFITAASMCAYDGRSVFDYGFLRGPIWKGLVVSSPGGNIAAGTYLTAWTLEYRSATGLLYRSPVGTTSTGTTINNPSSKMTHTLIGCSISGKQDYETGFGANSALMVSLVNWRSVANGQFTQRLTADPLANVTNHDPKTQFYTFVDDRSDTNIDGNNATLARRPNIYTASGQLEDEQPVSMLTSFIHKSRIFALGNDGKTWWYTKSFLDDIGVAPGFSVSFRIAFENEQTGGATLDDKAIFFGPTTLHYILGDGPAPSGANNDFTTPVRIQTDEGCANARSIVTMPDGVMFQARDGQVYLLTRALEVQPIGRPVLDRLQAYPNITSAVLVSKKNQVRFTANNDLGTEGVVLVFDYLVKQWSVFRYYDTDQALASTPIADACMWQDRYTFITPNGKVFYEDPADALDDGTYVRMLLETAWFNAAGPLGFDSVRKFALSGFSTTNHDLSLWVGFDNNPTYQQGPATFLAGSGTTATGPLERCEVTIGTRRKCQAIRFKVQDATPTDPGTYPVTTGRGPSFDTMAVEVGLKRGPRPVSATRKG